MSARNRAVRRLLFVLALIVAQLVAAVVAPGTGSLPGSPHADAVVTPGAGSAALSSHAAAAAADPTVPRVAYTDDRDGLLQFDTIKPFLGSINSFLGSFVPGRASFNTLSPPSFADANAAHESQPSSTETAQNVRTAFVSTRDSTAGDVYVNLQPGSGAAVLTRVTCDAVDDPAVETHPVVFVSATGEVFVAFASDRTGTVNPGHTNIWVAGPIVEGAPTNATTCAGVPPLVELPGQTGTNTWPAWITDSRVRTARLLVYSSTRDNPLGDLYEQDGNGLTAATRVTDGGGKFGSTQPAFVRGRTGFDTRYVVLCTTTEFRADGSLGEVSGPTQTEEATPGTTLTRPVVSAWSGTPPQSSDPVYGGDSGVAFSSTQTNPLGSVEISTRKAADPADPADYLFRADRVADAVDPDNPSAPASHPAWVGGSLIIDERYVGADVDDAQNTDGGDRRRLVHSTSVNGATTVVDDTSTPSYSPDGTQLAYSRRLTDNPADGRRIEIADPDGNAAVPLGDGFTADAKPAVPASPGVPATAASGATDHDLQPAWSPDGTRIAFVRAVFRYLGNDQTLTEISRSIWIADVAGNTAARVTPDADLTGAFYAHPSWSSDGTRIVVGHSVLPVDLRTGLTVSPASLNVGQQTTVSATVANAGPGTAHEVSVLITAPDGLVLDPASDPHCATAPTGNAVVCKPGDPNDPNDPHNLQLEDKATFTVTATATDDIPGSPARTVTATTTSDTNDYDTTNNTASVAVSTKTADVTATISAPAAIEQGDTFAVTGTITNNGPGTARNSTLTITESGGVDLTPPAGCTMKDAFTVVCAAGDLATNAAQQFTVQAKAAAPLTNAKLTATADSDTTDPDSGNDTASTTLSTRTADIQDTVQVTNNSNSDIDDNITVTIKNNGPGVATNVNVRVDTTTSTQQRDAAPTLTLVSGCPNTTTQNSSRVDCAFGSIASGDTRVLQFTWNGPCGGNTYYVGTRASTDTRDPNNQNDGNDEMTPMATNACPPKFRSPNGQIPITAAPHLARPAVKQVPVLPGSGYVGGAVRELGTPPVVADPQVWVITVATRAVDPLTDCETAACSEPDCAGDACRVRGTDPAWSPDGTQIAFDDGGALSVATLAGPVATSVNASDVRALIGFTDYTAGVGGDPTAARAQLSAGHDPAWAPGGELYFAGQPAGQSDQSGIYAIAPSGAGLRAVTQQPEPESQPTADAYVDVSVDLLAKPDQVVLGGTTKLYATVVNAGPSQALAVTARVTVPSGLTVVGNAFGCSVAGKVVTCPLGGLAAGTTLIRSITVRGTALGAHTATAAVDTTSNDTTPGNNTDSATVDVRAVVVPPPPNKPPGPGPGPAPGPGRPATDVVVTVSLAHPVAYVGGPVSATVRVRNEGPRPAANVRLQTAVPVVLDATAAPSCANGETACVLGTLPAGAVRTFALHFTPRAATPTPRNYTAPVQAFVLTDTIDTDASNDDAQADLDVRQPTVRLLPPIGPPGFVTIVFGQNFPPGSHVGLKWRPGITAATDPAKVAADGTVQSPMLVVHRDQLGRRLVVATSTTGRFTPVHAVMLVVPRSQSPPDFGGRG